MNLIRATLRISGRVQGVGYRNFVQQSATAFALTGWARNCADGDVEVVVEGEEGDIRHLINCCQQGPSHAQVDKVNMSLSAHTGEFGSFSIRY
ncbi:acylphosphatase [uncultured Desulfuromonas sp.]|uniref:acylphosphatase n=1 Tax=uncultured Desulfuromonas sp. TaxID=181013 RepID=UPI002AAAAE5D|nr:acylphosphatase [uncultured Desulfuromonas sp.]